MMKKIKKFLYKFFMLDKFVFSEIFIEKDVIEDICDFAKSLHPKEFLAILGGEIKNKKLYVNKLYAQEFVSSKNSVFFSSFLPNSISEFGTVHSHPSSNNKPSTKDLLAFNKKGVVHFIIGYPYTEKNISGYDFNGNEIKFKII